ncbi:MAG: LysM peptidoglycan-binding domain-containing protein [Bacilli bacterium]|nr:LysM peptidoglycan-binding domain-containing protein [Bacilli bacterium]
MRDTPNNETVIVEYGFADSNGDDVNQIKNNWQNLAEAVTKAIVEYAGGTYIAPSGSNYYTVKSGDTLWSIARKYNVSVDELKQANNLSGNLLNVGQNLIIPSLQDEKTDTYVVQKGDNLYAIARKLGTTVDNLKSINNLTTDALSIGQILKVPTATSTEKPNQSQEGTYTVQKGDSLYSIAQKYNTTVNEIKALNKLSSNLLNIGQILKIPSNSTNNIVYTVKQGDSLYSIAREFNTTVSAITALNNLSTSVLSIGQKLLLPN